MTLRRYWLLHFRLIGPIPEVRRTLYKDRPLHSAPVLHSAVHHRAIKGCFCIAALLGTKEGCRNTRPTAALSTIQGRKQTCHASTHEVSAILLSHGKVIYS